MRSRLTLLAMITAPVAVPAQAEPVTERQAAEAAEPCRAGPPEPVSSPVLRPDSTAVCAYDVKDMYRRLGQMISTPDARMSVESATRVFGLPPMEASHDSTRQASYTTVVSGAGGWKLRLWLRESAYPLDQKLTPAFVPGVRPSRLVDVDRLDVRYDITITLPDGADTPDHCMTAADAAALALAGGRKDDTVRASLMVSHLGPGSPTYVGKDGQRFSVSLRQQAGRLPTEAEMKANCVISALFMQPPKKAAEIVPARPLQH